MGSYVLSLPAGSIAGAVSPAGLINLNQFHFGVGLLCTLTMGNASAINYGAQVSGDNPVQMSNGQINTAPFTHWNAHDVLTNLTVSANDSLRYPCTAMRLILNTVTTPGNVAWTGNIAMAVVQTGSM